MYPIWVAILLQNMRFWKKKRFLDCIETEHYCHNLCYVIIIQRVMAQLAPLLKYRVPKKLCQAEFEIEHFSYFSSNNFFAILS